MAISKLFSDFSWRLDIPAPFDALDKVRTDFASIHNSANDSKSTLHAPTLRAIMAYLNLDVAFTNGQATDDLGAIGSQNSNMDIAEYPSGSGVRHAVVFTRNNGKLYAGKQVDPNDPSIVEEYKIVDGGDSGSAILFALIPHANSETEFSEYYNKLKDESGNGFSDPDALLEIAHKLCDNMYRRINGGVTLPNGVGIGVEVRPTGKIPKLTPAAMASGTYTPTNITFGEFKVFTAAATAYQTQSIPHKDFVGKYDISPNRVLTDYEKQLVPVLPEYYEIPQEIVMVAKHIQLTTEQSIPMRNFMFRGESGTGKTEGARAVASALTRPYVFQTCSADYERFDFIGQHMPVTNKSKAVQMMIPSLEAIKADPITAYFELTQGDYEENVTWESVCDVAFNLIAGKTITPQQVMEGGNKFEYVDTPFIQAMRNGWVIELQEPSVISKPGVMVALNSLLDNCGAISLPTGEVITRHPETVVIISTNTDYAGCRDMNQSVISRMNLVIDFARLEFNTLVERAMSITKCIDKIMVERMAQAVLAIANHCQDQSITDGVCGFRELVSWIQSYMITGDILESSKITVLSCASSDSESRENIKSTCLDDAFAA